MNRPFAICREDEPVPPALAGAVAAIGNFDGVHRGHQAVLALARAEAGALGAPTGVVTFEPHPRRYFDPGCAPFRLMDADARARRLAELGVAQLYELPFDAELAALSAEAFVREVLAGALKARAVVTGADFRFGHGRAGAAHHAALFDRDQEVVVGGQLLDQFHVQRLDEAHIGHRGIELFACGQAWSHH